LNVSHVCREAIRLKVELMDRAVKLDRMRDKSYTATLLPFGDNEILQNTGEEK